MDEHGQCHVLAPVFKIDPAFSAEFCSGGVLEASLQGFGLA